MSRVPHKPSTREAPPTPAKKSRAGDPEGPRDLRPLSRGVARVGLTRPLVADARSVPEIVVSCLEEAEENGDAASWVGNEAADPRFLSPSRLHCSWEELHELVPSLQSAAGFPRATSMPNVFYLPPISSPPPSFASVSPPPSPASLSPCASHASLSSPPPSPASLSSSPSPSPSTLSSRMHFLTVSSPPPTSRRTDPDTFNMATHSSSPESPRSPEGRLGCDLSPASGPAKKTPRRTAVHELFTGDPGGVCPPGGMLLRSRTMRKLVYSLGPENFKTLYFEKLNNLRQSSANKGRGAASGRGDGYPGDPADPPPDPGKSRRRVVFGECPTRAQSAQPFCQSMSPEAQAAMKQEYARAGVGSAPEDGDGGNYDAPPSER